MATTSRFGTWLILSGGAALLAVMAYALSLGGDSVGPSARDDAVEVAVFYPDSNSWRNFRQGAAACVDRGLATIVDQGTDYLVVRSDEGGTVRFTWDGSLGIREIRDSLAARLEAPARPIAVVGSTNTALTAALARELAEHAGEGSERGSADPALIITSATAVEIGDPPGRDEPSGVAGTPLLDVYRGRTFRFCLNNARLAELVVGYLAERRGEAPAEVVLVVDSFDPFSEDLATQFRAAVERRFPGLAIVRSEPAPGSGGLAGSPSADEVELARAIWSKATSARSGPVWVLLTTQGSPAQRLLEVLRAYAPRPSDRPDNLRVLCGDGIGRLTLDSFAGSLPFPVYSAASSSAGLPEIPAFRGGTSGQIEAEVISAIVSALESPGAGLSEELSALSIRADQLGSLGRTLRFRAGERAGDDLGHVIEARPDRPGLLAHEPGDAGRWTDFEWTPDGWKRSEPASGGDAR